LGLLLVPVLEIAVVVAVGRVIGAAATVLLVLVGCVAGVLVLRRVGAGAVRRLATSGGYVETPARGAGETGAMVLAGLLLVFPGLVTDVVGLLLLIPPVRRTLVRRTGSALAARVQRLDVQGLRVVQGQVITGAVPGAGDVRPGTAGGPGAGGHGAVGDADRVDVKVIQIRDVDPPGGIS
jgi:UPF0716 protein FxsA